MAHSKIHDPGNTHKIDTIYVWLSVDENDLEGIIAFDNMPLFSSEKELVESVRARVEKLIAITGKKAILVEFARKQ